MNIQNIQLSKLQVSPINVRKTATQSIADLIASIRSVGLLNPLTVNPGDDGIFYVVAGSRRLAALREVYPADAEVPCTVLDAGDVDVFEASLAENVIREAMHPADQFDAFKQMVDAGYPIDDVAARFGVTSLMVRQRLKLANVSPKLIAEYRAGNATLEQMQALAITDDHDRQEQVWEDASDWGRRPETLRRSLTEDEIQDDDYRVEFVGLDAYEAAGGVVRRDLFGDEAYIADVDLLTRLVAEKLSGWAERVKAEGWAWVDVFPTMGYEERSRYANAGPARVREFTAEEDAEFNALCTREAELDQFIEDFDWDQDDTSPADDADKERDKVQERKDEMHEACQYWPEELMAKSGALVWLNRNNGLRIDRGLLRPGEKMDKAGKVEQTKPAKDHSKLSDSATEKLYGDMTVMLRNGLEDQPALAALATALWTALEHGSDSVPVQIGAKHTLTTPAMREAMTDDDTDGELEKWQKILKPHRGKVLEYLLKEPQVALELLAFASRRSIIARDDAVRFAGRVGIDLAEQWEVTTEWLAAQSKGFILAALKEVKAKTEGFDKLKTAELATKATPILQAKGWKPAPIRAPKAVKRDRKQVVADQGEE